MALLLFAIAAGAILPIHFGIYSQFASWVASPVRGHTRAVAIGLVALGVVPVRGL